MTAAQAQDTSKPIRIIVPFATGGSNDIVGRAIAQQLSTRLKRNVYVENRAGGGGTLGSEIAARGEPDGTTLLLISSTFTMNASIMKLSYDPVKSFTPVAMLGMGPSVIAVSSSLPVNSIKELVDYSKKNPGTVNFGSSGVASFQHFAIELFKARTGADLTIVHYKGGSPALVDLAAGHVQVSLGSLIQMQPFLKSGRIKLLAVAGPKRVEMIQNVPTLKESGIDVDASNWWALLAPAGTPAAIVDQLHRETNAVLTDPEIKTRFAREGADAMPMTRPEFEKLIATETRKWAEVAKETGIKPE
ncbi:tripartite tricarboxylate transporter substrate binding protein [Ottowia thiooxydans]|uniref:tripartite tricarboxylate transporter substrate binding protein n=1 Tax=Ottowia thiooxydans TaxID=219182 RepID=UPI00146CF319|nr:tripartite tricarboxylate transporter substrate binding protein [Ottowia thiooxydans]